jgi:GNAT superfamily N-acetyltransferase
MSISADLGCGTVPFLIEPRAYTDAEVQRLVTEVQEEYVRRYGGPDGAAVEAGEFSPPEGLFLVGLLDGVPVATGGWRRIDDGMAEIKRMFVAQAARRRGLARAVLAELERTAAAAGYRELVLNTGPRQPEAVALYEAVGYVRSAPFGHYACHPRALFYRKQLAASAVPG